MKIIFKILIAILFFTGMQSNLYSQITPKIKYKGKTLEQTVHDYIMSFPKHKEFSGVIIVANGNDIIMHRGYNMASHEFGIPNRENTRFQIGSISKAFTAMLVLKLVEEGLIDLNKTISDYLPYYPEETGKKITINHLLSSTSGIPQHIDAVPDYWTVHDHVFHRPKDLLSLFWDIPLKHKPGEDYTYSSPGFYILGAVIQQVTRKSYSELLQEHIFIPLAMENTFVENNLTTDINMATGYIRGLSGPVKAYPEDKSSALAAGDIVSTAYDLYLWQKTLSLNADNILSAESKKQMFKPVLPKSYMTYVGPQYNIPYDDGKKNFVISMLNGNSSGYMSFIGRKTEDDICIIVLSNINDTDVTRIGDDIGDIYSRHFLGMAVGPEAPLTQTPPEAAKVEKSSLDKVLGFYRKSKGSYTGVIRDNQKIYSINYNKGWGLQMIMELIPITVDSFYLSYNTSFRCTFSNDKKDGRLVISPSRNGRFFNEAKKIELGNVNNSEYEGYFTSVELQQTYRLSIKSNQLVAENFLGESDVDLIHLEKDVYGFNKGFFEFIRDKNDAITEIKVFTINTDQGHGSKFIKIVY